MPKRQLPLKGRDLISLADLRREETLSILSLAEQLKREVARKRPLNILSGRVIGLLFEKPSTRTRAGFETAVLQLGGSTLYMRSDELQLKRGEPIKDTSRVLGSYLDGLVIRTYDQANLTEFAQYSEKPVINALSDLEHPTQIICDLLTIVELHGTLENVTIAWIGDGNNVCNSLLLGCSILGVSVNVATPARLKPNKAILERAKELAKSSGAKITLTTNAKSAVEQADFVYTDVWVSMGQEKQHRKKLTALREFQVNSKLMKHAKPSARVMHCLPAHRGQEISDEVLEGSQSVAWLQAENKLHGARGILAALIP